jgi:hypothetical protein
LTQDPICQLSSDTGSPRPRRVAARRPVKVNRRKLFGDIDLSKFRLPKLRDPARQAPGDHADGFESEEVFPIGRPMPIPQRGRPPSQINKLRASKTELTLVADKEFGLECQDADQSDSETNGQSQLEKLRTVTDSNGPNQQRFILVDPFLDDHDSRNTLENGEIPELVDDMSTASDMGTPGIISSPLTRKESQMRKVRFSESATERAEESQSSTVDEPPAGSTELPENDMGSGEDQQRLDASSFSSNTPSRHTKDNLDVLQELAMVSVWRREESSNSDESSDVASYLDGEAHSEIYWIEREHGRGDDIISDQDAKEERDIQMEGSVKSYLHQPESEPKSDNIEDDSDIESDELQNRSTDLKVDRETRQETKGIWRPRRPRTVNIAMDVDGIISSPEAPRAILIAPSNQYSYKRRLYTTDSQQLTMTGLPRTIAYDSQVSVELGDTQKLICHSSGSSIPDAEMDDAHMEAGKESSQYTFIPEDKYFSRASQQLEETADYPSLARVSSLPSSTGRYSYERDEEITTSSNTSEAQLSQSPSSRQEHTLRTLSRPSSLSFTAPLRGASSRMVSLPFDPPFKR